MKINLLLLLFLMGLNGLMAQWDKVYPAKNGYSAVLKDKKFGFIDANQKVVIAPKYEMAYDFNSDGLVVVKKDGKFGCIDVNEKILIPFNYDKLFDIENPQEGLQDAGNTDTPVFDNTSFSRGESNFSGFKI